MFIVNKLGNFGILLVLTTIELFGSIEFFKGSKRKFSIS